MEYAYSSWPTAAERRGKEFCFNREYFTEKHIFNESYLLIESATLLKYICGETFG